MNGSESGSAAARRATAAADVDGAQASAAGGGRTGAAGSPAPDPEDPFAHLRPKLKLIPGRPGVYLMKNSVGEVIYVGKATSLKSRVRSYFQRSRDQGAKHRALVSNVADIDYIVTDSEVEALILESNLIKRYAPWYNVRLKDDKAYPYIKLTTNEAFPRVVMVRRPKADGARYFGPYTNVGAVRSTLRFLQKLFPLRTCDLDLSTKRDYRPCLQYHIGRCPAPCANLTTEKAYGDMIEQVTMFLEGRQNKLVPALRRNMEEASRRLEFERAGRIRDQIQALEQVAERQKIVSDPGKDFDVVGFAREGELACVQLFFVRDGKVIGREPFFLDVMPETEDDEMLTAFVQQHYAKAGQIPREILLQSALEEGAVGTVTSWLTSRRQSLSKRKVGRVRLLVPERGERRRLVEMVRDNAELALNERRERTGRRQAENERGLEELKEHLGLPDLPRRIEAFDISNTQGVESVASMVVLLDGEPANQEYRRFKIKSVDGPNDFASMHEVIHRRFLRGLREREELEKLPPDERQAAAEKAKFATFPDLVLIDGGKGQLGAARDALRQLGLEEMPAIGLAERFEHIFVEDDPDPIVLERNSNGLHLVQRLRDEAHRFALGYHRNLRDKRSIGSSLDQIPGVGPKRKKQLIKHFGSVKAVREAELEQLMEVPGLPQDVAERIYQQWRSE